MKYIPFIFFVFIIACEQVADVDVPEHESQLVLSSYYRAGETKITARLTGSLAIDNNGELEEVWGATVNLYENELFIGQLEDRIDTTYSTLPSTIDSLGNFVYEIDEIIRAYKLELSASLESGKTYKITAEAPNFPGISATQQLPSPPTIIDTSYLPMSTYSLTGELMNAINITLQDVEDEDNYYEFKIYGYWNNESGQSLTPGIERGYNGTLLLKDDLFENSPYNIELLSSSTSPNNARVHVSAISRDKYMFFRSLEIYDSTIENPFAEPIIVHSNVENGQGIFSMENKSEFLVE